MGQLLFVMKSLACAFWRNTYLQWDVALQAFRAVPFKIPPRDSFTPRNIFPRHNHATITRLGQPKQTAAVSSTIFYSVKKSFWVVSISRVVCLFLKEQTRTTTTVMSWASIAMSSAATGQGPAALTFEKEVQLLF